VTEASDGPGDLHVATVVINVQDMRRAVDFWCAALGHRQRDAEMDPEFEAVPAPAAAHHQPVGQVGGRQGPEDVRRGLDVQPVTEPEALRDERGHRPGAGRALALDRRDERGDVDVPGRGLRDEHADQREDALAEHPAQRRVAGEPGRRRNCRWAPLRCRPCEFSIRPTGTSASR